MAAQHLSLVVLLCMVFAGTVNCDVHGYIAKLEAALNASGALPLDNPPLQAQALKCVGGEIDACDTSIDKCLGDATSVHGLCPNHIQVIAALGDSVTAALGAQASNIFEAFTEYRGVSWSIGGIDTVSSCTTLPNIVKKYNPSVKGYSTGTGDENHSNAQLNLAVSGSIAEDMPGQAEKLVAKMKDDSTINFEEDWKMVTLWIGGNNLCAYCGDQKDQHSADRYIEDVQKAVDILHEKLPRTFVNLVQILHVTRIAKLSGFICGIVHTIACDCAANNEDEVFQETLKYQEKIEELVNSGRYSDKEDFTVVLQPFFKDVDVPQKDGNPDTSYFSPDCFHFSVKGHREAAVALWNNMLEPVGAKSTNWVLGQPIKCPNPGSPYFYTSENSKLSFNSQSTNEGGEEEEDEGNGSDNSNLGIILGTSITAYMAVIALSALVVGVALVLRRRRRSGGASPSGEHPTPKTSLITKTSSL